MTRRCIADYEAPFNQWLRAHPDLDSSPSGAALSIQNVDFVIHRYLVRDKASGRCMGRQHLMLVELKTYSAASAAAQRDTLGILDQLLHHADRTVVNAKRGRVRVFYHGLHVLTLENQRPDDGGRIYWDQRWIRETTLIELLAFRRDAWTLRPREDRLHHRSHPALAESWL